MGTCALEWLRQVMVERDGLRDNGLAYGRRCASSHIMWKFNGGHHFRQTFDMGCTGRLGSRAKKRAIFRKHCLDFER